MRNIIPRTGLRGALLALSLVCAAGAVGGAGAATGDHVWSKGFDADGRAAFDGGGNIVSAGRFFAMVDFGGGLFSPTNIFVGDVFIARFDGGGNHLWSTQFSPTGFGDVKITDLEADATGNFYIAGVIGNGSIDFGGGVLTGPGETFVVKFDATGAHLWSQTFGAGQINGISISGTHVAIAGQTSGTVDFGGGPLTSAGGSDLVVALITSAGAHVWSDIYGDTDEQRGTDVSMDASGDVVVAGSLAGTVDFGGGALSSPDLDAILVEFDAAGNHSWSKIFDGTFTPSLIVDLKVATDASENVVLSGEMHGTVDFGGGALTSAGAGDLFVAVFDAAGTHQWSDNYGGTATELPHAVSFDAGGNVVVSGGIGGAVDFGGGPVSAGGFADHFAAMFDAAGAHVWSAAYGSSSSDWLCRSDVGPAGEVLLHGGGSPGVDFGGGALAVSGFFMAELGGAGTASAATTPQTGVSLEQNVPNPFNPSTTIRFVLPAAQRVELAVYDARGRLVATLTDGFGSAGVNEVQWNGTTRTGGTAASGVYYYRLQTANASESRKMLLLK